MDSSSSDIGDLLGAVYARHATALETLPDDLRIDTLQLAAVLMGPMALALAEGLDVGADCGQSEPWSNVLHPSLRPMVESLGTIGLEGRIALRGDTSGDLYPRCCPILLPRSSSGVSMLAAAWRIAESEAARIFSEPDVERPT